MESSGKSNAGRLGKININNFTKGNPMKTKMFYVVVCLLTTVFLGCKCSCNKEAPGQNDQIRITSTNLNHIIGTQWILQKMTVDGSEYQLAEEMPFIKFEADGKINGFASINRFFGSMQIDEQGKVEWSKDFGSTKMAGPESLMKQEDAFLQALTKTDELAVEGIYLHAYSDDRKIELVFYVPVK